MELRIRKMERKTMEMLKVHAKERGQTRSDFVKSMLDSFSSQSFIRNVSQGLDEKLLPLIQSNEIILKKFSEIDEELRGIKILLALNSEMDESDVEYYLQKIIRGAERK